MSSPTEKLPFSSGLVTLTATALTSLLAGFLLGRLYGGDITNKSNASGKARTEPVQMADSDDGEDEGGVIGPLNDFATTSEECKLALVVRTDLGMTKGKADVRIFYNPQHFSCDIPCFGKAH